MDSISARVRVTSACLNCKRRKRKCTGAYPCDSCSAHHTDCIYDESLDRRRKESLRKVRMDSAIHKVVLNGVMSALRAGKDEEVKDLVNADLPLDQLAEHFKEASKSDSDPSVSSSVMNSPGDSRTSKTPSVHNHNHHHHQHQHHHSRNRAQTLLTWPPKRQACSAFLESLSQAKLDQQQGSHMKGMEHMVYNHGSLEKLSPADEPDSEFSPVPGHIEVFGNFTFPLSPNSNGNGTKLEQEVSNYRLPAHLIQPLNATYEPCPLTVLLLRFRDAGRRAIAQGEPAVSVVGSKGVDLTLAFRDRKADDPHTPSTWACEFQRQFEDVDIYVRLAGILFLNSYMKWLILPSKENYELMPKCIRPTTLQRLIPHHAAIDICPCPTIRDILIYDDHGMMLHDERDYIVSFQMAGVSTNWPLTLGDAITRDITSGNLTLTQAFIDHVSDMTNWHIGRLVLSEYPEFEGQINLADEDVIEIDTRKLHDLPGFTY